jgi:hypothetical protein
MDADGQHLSNEICKLTEAINTRDDTIVTGTSDFETGNVPSSSKTGRSISNF